MKPKITIESPIRCYCNKEAREKLLPLLKYKELIYIPNKQGFGGEKKIVEKHLITGRKGTGGRFFIGHLPRIINETEIEVEGKIPKIKPDCRKPILDGITFRKDQEKALSKIRIKQKGRVVFPTGTGKTVVASGAIKMFTSINWIFLVHTIDLLNQTSEEFSRFGIKHIKNGGSNKLDFVHLKKQKNVVVVSTIQSAKKMFNVIPEDFFQGVIVDEAHHVNSFDSAYGNFLIKCKASIRIGFTATLPTIPLQLLVNEGLFGSVIYEMNHDEGMKAGILAKAMVKIIPIPFETELEKSTYQQTVTSALVNNKTRNEHIIKESLKAIENKNSILIIVDKIEHGLVLRRLFANKGVYVPFVEGIREDEFRKRTKKKLKEKKIYCVICTKVWREGINIPSLNVIIYAAGGKDEKSVKQAMGRGTRLDKGKDKILLIDFLDPFKWLSQHSVQRYKVYYDLGWIK